MSLLFTGKSGADAIFKALKRVCIVLTKYRSKLNVLVSAASGAGVITSAQETQVNSFLDSAAALCAIFEILADESGFTGPIT